MYELKPHLADIDCKIQIADCEICISSALSAILILLHLKVTKINNDLILRLY